MRENTYIRKSYRLQQSTRDPRTSTWERARIKCQRLMITKGTANRVLFSLVYN